MGTGSNNEKTSTVRGYTRIISILLLLMVMMSSVCDAVKVLMWCGYSWSGFDNNPWRTPNYLGQTVKKEECEVPCKLIGDKSRASEADAIMFEAQPLGNFGYAYLSNMPEFPQKEVGQKFVNFGFEHEDYFPIQHEPMFLDHIDMNATFRSFNQVHLTFTCSWGMYENGSIDNFKEAPVRPFDNKTHAIAFMATNCHGGGAIYRTNYIQDLMRYIKVDAMGECMNNKKLSPEEFPKPVFNDLGLSMKIKRQVFNRYMFSLAFENNNKTDYVSEKVYTCLLSGSLPIYMGAPNIDDYVPENSIVKTNDFKSPQHLAEYLQYLMTNETAYNQYFEWKNKPYPQKFRDMYAKCVFYTGECNICKYVDKLMKQDRAIADSTPGLEQPGFREVFGEPAELRNIARTAGLTKGSCLVVQQNSTIPPIQGGFTFSAWIYPEGVKSNILFTLGGDGKTATKMSVRIYQFWRRYYIQYCYKVASSLSSDEMDEECITGERPIVHGAWRHIALTISSTGDHREVVRLYVNGKVDAESTLISETRMDSTNIRIGCEDPSFEGNVDDVIVWRRALTEKEISRTMFKKYRGDEPGLSTYITFNDAKAILDYSVYRSPVTVTNIHIKDDKDRQLNLNSC